MNWKNYSKKIKELWQIKANWFNDWLNNSKNLDKEHRQ